MSFSAMTGISDVVRSVRSLRRNLLHVVHPHLHAAASLLPAALRDGLRAALAAACAGNDPLGAMPQAKLGFFQEHPDACNPFGGPTDYDHLRDEPINAPHFWGLLLPVCCRDAHGGEACFERLEGFAASLENSLELSERKLLRIYLGIDQFDVFYDRDDTIERVTELFTRIGVPATGVHSVKLRSHYRGKLCRIWDTLTRTVVRDGCCFAVLVGDDVRFLTRGWKEEVEASFARAAARSGLPYGAACVAFRDVTFPVFPTFPVVHRSHLRVFGGLLPPEFVNQHGDPFLFQLYRRLGTAEFAPTASLENTVGGAGPARYVKQHVEWQGELLASAVTKLLMHYTPGRAAMPCIDVVVPTFRCDPSALRCIAALTTRDASVNILLIVDNPASLNLPDLLTLQDWSLNHLVRVHCNARNLGASASRNIGIAASAGDLIVLLDDDIVPDASLLEAYLGAAKRNPAAHILVGTTALSPPVTLAQHALAACQMTFFYDVARRMEQPPWGVTANLCLHGRPAVWFSETYPRSGGGEDVDFCLRLKDTLPAHARGGALVAVPEARVVHPFWRSITAQVVGWALGDVLCLSALPTRAFYAPPNWAEFLLLVTLFAAYTSALSWLVRVVPAVAMLEVVLNASTALPHTSSALRPHVRVLVSLTAAWPPMVQDVARLASKLARLRLTHVCLQLDWLDGQREHVSVTRIALVLKNAAFLLLTLSLLPWVELWHSVLAATGLLVFVVTWHVGQRYDAVADNASFVTVGLLPPLSVAFPACSPQPFVVLAYQRTGSNLLCGRLHNHPSIAMHNEVFNVARAWTYLDEDVRSDPTWHWNIFSRDSDPLAFIVNLFTRQPSSKQALLNTAEGRAVGFKLFPDHFTDSNTHALRRLLADERVKKVILRRENVLSVYVSKLRADKSGHYLAKRLDDIAVRINPAALDAFARHYDATYAYYEQCVMGQDVYHVTYEQLADADIADDTLRGVLRFLGVDALRVPPPLDVTVKQSSKPLAEGISNFADVELAFRHHPRVKKSFEGAA